MVVTDTNVVSRLMCPTPISKVAGWIAERDGEEIYLTAVSEAELLYGVAIVPADLAVMESLTRHVDREVGEAIELSRKA